MTSKSLGRLAGRVLASATLTVMAACSELARTGRSPAFVVIDALEAASGAEPDDFGNVLDSDVETMVDEQIDGKPARVAAFFSDTGRVTLRLALKNPGSPSTPLMPSPLNEITMTRYRVTFRRADGRNAPGIDIPHAFDGAVTFTIRADAPTTATFDLVRFQAKLEPPLSSLRRGGGASVISTIAEVTFYGSDQSGHDVAVAGVLSVNFSDFRDPR